MAFEVTFELTESDLKHFRNVMRQALSQSEKLSEQEIITSAKNLSLKVKDDVPEFVKIRLKKLETLVDMIEDREWKIPEQERSDVMSALSYFSDPQDLVADDIPVLGFLDDAIMIELVAEELQPDIEAFKEFCIYREREEGRSDDEVITRDEWLDSKRRELHSRMRNRRTTRSSGRSSFRSIF